MENHVTELIQAVEKADTSEGLLDAVKALCAVRHQAAIPTLIEVLKYNNPGAAVAAVDGLIEIGEIAVSPILEQVDGYNYGARAWATRALAGIGDPRALELLLDAALNDFSLSVRRAAAKGLGSIRWDKISGEDAQTAQEEVLNALIKVSHDPEWVVRYAAVVGLENFAVSTKGTFELDKIFERFQEMKGSETEQVICARIQLAESVLNFSS
ncbi:HEAT repeat domain-containing protein [Chroococcus sp. FPU101]|uniref:HEAT repeat domain-containing protein n=1 Tax=Chroococcus sp. FPU101 TaxID=1974212 RepID=UPI001A8E385C|nr:HEAT repeat domain-containing protein [Chroococcus sp. FPU101]